MSKSAVKDPKVALERLTQSSDSLGALQQRLSACRRDIDGLTTELARQLRRQPSAASTARPRSRRA